MDAEQEEYSEDEKDVGVSCNSEECQDIAQKTMVCLCFLLFYSTEKLARLTPSFWFLGNGCRTRGVFRGREKRWRFLQLRGVPGYWTENNGMSLFSTFLLSRKGSQINFFWFLENGCRTRGVFRGGERRWGLLQLRGVPGYWTKNNGMSLFSTFLLFRKGSGVNSFLLVFRKWMQNKRSIPRKRTTLTFPATPRSARILDKRQWYVFVFYFSSLQKSWRG